MSVKMGKILHLGIVVEDVYQASKIYEEELGIGPWEISEAWRFFADKEVNGKKGLNITSAMFHGDGYEIELIMPVGDGVYKDWLEMRGPGLHHVIMESEDSSEDILAMAERVSGRKPYLEVKWPDGRPLVAYADLLQETGLLLEVSPKHD